MFATILVKVGGSVIRKGVENVLQDLKNLVEKGNKVILVHGGGYYITELMEKLNIKPVFVKSPSGVVSRYTDWNTLWCYVMGMMWINKTIVSRLQELNINALGISGVDGKLLLAKKKENIIIVDERGRQRVIDGGFTGKIVSVNVDLLKMLIDSGYVPVIAPIAINEKGIMLNVDSDQVTYMVSVSLKPDYCIILLDVDGLIINGNVVPKLSPEKAEKLFRESKEVRGGMKRKLYMASQIAKEGIRVVLYNGLRERPIQEAINGKGTTISRY